MKLVSNSMCYHTVNSSYASHTRPVCRLVQTLETRHKVSGGSGTQVRVAEWKIDFVQNEYSEAFRSKDILTVISTSYEFLPLSQAREAPTFRDSSVKISLKELERIKGLLSKRGQVKRTMKEFFSMPMSTKLALDAMHVCMLYSMTLHPLKLWSFGIIIFSSTVIVQQFQTTESNRTPRGFSLIHNRSRRRWTRLH